MAGRPAFKPTPSHRRDVELLKADGWANDRIAGVLGISRPTLEKAFPLELEYGRDRVQLEALRNLRRLARKSAAANKLLQDRIVAAGTLRQDPPDPQEPKLGKKQRLQLAADNPDTSTDMGDLMARRAAVARKLN